VSGATRRLSGAWSILGTSLERGCGGAEWRRQMMRRLRNGLLAALVAAGVGGCTTGADSTCEPYASYGACDVDLCCDAEACCWLETSDGEQFDGGCADADAIVSAARRAEAHCAS
jgi:hypothetical protein